MLELKRAVTIAYHGIIDADRLCVLDVDTISVRTKGWGVYFEAFYVHSFAAIKFEMELRAVLDP